MRTLHLFHSRSIYILALYYLLLFNTVDYSNQLSNKVLKGDKSTEILLTIDGCKDVLRCERVESHKFFNMEFGICEKCKDRPLEIECSSIPIINSSYKLLSFTNGFNKEFYGINEYNKTTSIIEKGVIDESAVLFSGKFVNLSGIEYCALDESNQIELLQEIYLIYNQHQNNENLVLNIKLKNPFQINESGTLEIISNWDINNKKSNHAMYAYTKFKEKMSSKKFEFSSNIDSRIFNKIWPSISVACNSNNVQIFDQVKPCMRISCRGQKEKGTSNINKGKSKRIAVNDIIASVNLLKNKVNSESDYLLYVSILIKTLLKSLERKTKRGKISIGCSMKITSWVKEVCEILGIRTDENSNMGRYISKFTTNTEKKLNFSKNTINATEIVELEQSTSFIEAGLEDYKRLEEELKEF
ncbi:signal peptide protein [Cryptosporidium sp. chipmunk genotype I]|uniref:signal peptide protein n=1 Tax=Cryptosporidium sp. chipmunk genotype I TaxID=1280935 RepID=UPI00351A647F|nr:signal peptide protein [Cryptosporidium sp. chipmunk genotype I]